MLSGNSSEPDVSPSHPPLFYSLKPSCPINHSLAFYTCWTKGKTNVKGSDFSTEIMTFPWRRHRSSGPQSQTETGSSNQGAAPFRATHGRAETQGHRYNDASLLSFHKHHSMLLQTFSYGCFSLLYSVLHMWQSVRSAVWRSTGKYNLPLSFSHAQRNIAETSRSKHRWKRWAQSTRTFKIKVIETNSDFDHESEPRAALRFVKYICKCVWKMNNKAEKTQHKRYRNICREKATTVTQTKSLNDLGKYECLSIHHSGADS